MNQSFPLSISLINLVIREPNYCHQWKWWSSIKYQVLNIPTKVSYYQEEGHNYRHWRRSKEELGYKAYPKDYESDVSVSSDHEKDVKKIQ